MSWHASEKGEWAPMNDTLQERSRLIETLGFPREMADHLAASRTLAQVREWVRRSLEKESPMRYFKVLHRANEPVKPAEEIRRDAAAALAETADPAKEERRRRRDRVYLTLRSPEHPWQEDTQETREALLIEFGFHPIAAGEMARGRSLETIIQWIDASETEENPWVFVRQQLTCSLCESAWPEANSPRAASGPTDLRLIQEWGRLGKWLRLPDGRVVMHRPCPPGWGRYTERLRDVLGREPWTDYSEAGGKEIRFGGLSDILIPAKPNPAEVAKARVKAILENQARGTALAQSLAALKGENDGRD